MAYIAGRAPSRWGSFGPPAGTPPPAQGQVQPPMLLPPNATPAAVAAATAIRRAHPLYPMVTLSLLTEILNSRLFTTVRDALGLTYDVSFELNLFDRLDAGWFVVHVTSTPQKIHEALAASLNVLRQLDTMRVTLRELQRAQRTLITRHESELKDNSYWLGLLTHLQSPSVPYKSIDCLRDLRPMFEAVTLEDVYQAYGQFDFGEGGIFTCVGTSGQEAPAAAVASAADGMVLELGCIHRYMLSAQGQTRRATPCLRRWRRPCRASTSPRPSRRSMIPINPRPSSDDATSLRL